MRAKPERTITRFATDLWRNTALVYVTTQCERTVSHAYWTKPSVISKKAQLPFSIYFRRFASGSYCTCPHTEGRQTPTFTTAKINYGSESRLFWSNALQFVFHQLHIIGMRAPQWMHFRNQPLHLHSIPQVVRATMPKQQKRLARRFSRRWYLEPKWLRY